MLLYLVLTRVTFQMELCQQSEGERQRETTRALPILAQTHVLQKICVESKFFSREK